MSEVIAALLATAITLAGTVWVARRQAQRAQLVVIYLDLLPALLAKLHEVWPTTIEDIEIGGVRPRTWEDFEIGGLGAADLYDLDNLAGQTRRAATVAERLTGIIWANNIYFDIVEMVDARYPQVVQQYADSARSHIINYEQWLERELRRRFKLSIDFLSAQEARERAAQLKRRRS